MLPLAGTPFFLASRIAASVVSSCVCVLCARGGELGLCVSCVYVCVRALARECTCACMHACMHAYVTYTHTHTRTHTHTHTCTCTHICVCVCVCVCVKHARLRTHALSSRGSLSNAPTCRHALLPWLRTWKGSVRAEWGHGTEEEKHVVGLEESTLREEQRRAKCSTPKNTGIGCL